MAEGPADIVDAVSDSGSEMFPTLTVDQVQRMLRYGMLAEVGRGDVLYGTGQTGFDFIVLVTAAVEIVRDALDDEFEAVVARCGQQQFSW